MDISKVTVSIKLDAKEKEQILQNVITHDIGIRKFIETNMTYDYHYGDENGREVDNSTQKPDLDPMYFLYIYYGFLDYADTLLDDIDLIEYSLNKTSSGDLESQILNNIQKDVKSAIEEGQLKFVYCPNEKAIAHYDQDDSYLKCYTDGTGVFCLVEGAGYKNKLRLCSR